jgi:hypothetical protein
VEDVYAPLILVTDTEYERLGKKLATPLESRCLQNFHTVCSAGFGVGHRVLSPMGRAEEAGERERLCRYKLTRRSDYDDLGSHGSEIRRPLGSHG